MCLGGGGTAKPVHKCGLHVPTLPLFDTNNFSHGIKFKIYSKCHVIAHNVCVRVCDYDRVYDMNNNNLVPLHKDITNYILSVVVHTLLFSKFKKKY